MHKVPYDIQHFEYAGDTVHSHELLKASGSRDCWEAKTQTAQFTLTFMDATTIDELHLGLASHVAVTVTGVVQGGGEVLFAKDLDLRFNPDTAMKEGCHKCVVANPAHGTKYSHLRICFQNLKLWNPMKVCYITVHAVRSATLPTSPPSKRPSLSVSPTPAKRAKTAASPESIGKSPASVKKPIVISQPAECSYSDILAGCVVSTLTPSEHVRKLCECMGAGYTEQVSDGSTHLVISEASKSPHLRYTHVQVISLAWLERCFDLRTRTQEREYLI